VDLELSPDQLALEDAVAKIGDYRGLADGGYLDAVRDAGPIEGVLVVEQAAASLLDGPVAARVLAGPLAGVTDLPPAVGLAHRDLARGGRGVPGGVLVRWAPVCDAFLVLDGDRAGLASRDDAEVEPVESAFGAPYGRVTLRRSDDIGPAGPLRRAWRIAIAAEAEGLMLAAITKTADHVTHRQQFGHPIGAFQAVQHRVAAAYAMAMGTRWLARRAAWYADDDFLCASAAAYACEAAQLTYTNTHQVTGAIGITSEYGLVGWTTRLLGLRQELGGQRAHARAVAAARRAMDKPWPSPLPLP